MKAALALVCLSLAAPVAAQPHPCTQPYPTSPPSLVEGTAGLAWCHSGKGASGGVETITGWALYVDGVRTVIPVGTAPAQGPPNAAGETLYRMGIALIRGSHTYQLAGIDATGEGAKSTPPLALSVVAPMSVPDQVRGLRASQP